MHYNYWYNIVIFFVVVLMPIYPALASFVHSNTVLDFYRGDIDESSIIDSYVGDEEGAESTGLIVETKDSFLSINTLLDGERDVSETSEVVNYEVKSGESISTIADKFWISLNSIYWANNLSKSSVIRPGDTVKVPPVSGIIHQVKSGDTLSSLAKKYDIPEDKIRKQNDLSNNNNLIAGTVIVLPGAIKKYEAPKKPVISVTKYFATNKDKGTKSSYKKVVAGKKLVIDTEAYTLSKRSPKHSFAWWNCTRFVAQYKNVDWSWNAKDWLRNARNKGHATGNTPSSGAIIVFNGRGYNPVYGHVGIVVEVEDNQIIIKDMNYRSINEVTTRKVSKNDWAIRWYIYVD
jgi:surface antigen/uncharacterized protein (DUF433 family)